MIWCVEDDARIRELELYALRSSGFETRDFEDGKTFWEMLQKEQPELVLLDVMLPEIDGIDLLKRMRSQDKFKGIPVIMATAKGEEYDRIKGLELGADDYIVKPFSMLEMVLRVKAVLRRTQPMKSDNILSAGGVVLNLDEHTVIVDESRVQLTYKEFELLRIFLNRPGKVFAREQLFTSVWNLDYMGDSRTLDIHIRTLRQKLGKYGKMIETVRNLGYRLEVGCDKKDI